MYYFFHLFKNFWFGNNSRGFFDNFLMSSLNGTISAEKRDSIAVIISKQLHFQMPRTFCQFHNEYR